MRPGQSPGLITRGDGVRSRRGARVFPWLALLVAIALRPASASTPATEFYFVGPKAAGTARGHSAADRASFRDKDFWHEVGTRLAVAPVTVTFVAGKYIISSDPKRRMPALQLTRLGHDQHVLTLTGSGPDEAVFTRHPDDARTGDKGPGFLFLTNCRNVVVRNFAFTAPHVPIGYATNFGRNQHVLVEDCHWYDLQGVYYGATGTAGEATEDITFRRCRFERVGSGGHAHMIYNAYGPRRIRVIDCTFEDCAGDFVRFRDRTDYALVTGCTFHSTGKFTGVHAPFISIPLFNDDDPAARKPHPGYEYFGTHFLFYNNTFTYDTPEKPTSRIAVVFHHSGFDPPGAQFLLDPASAAVLRNGTTAQKQALLRECAQVDTSAVHIYGNRATQVAHAGVYRCQAAYGAKPRGGEGMFDIADTFNAQPLAPGDPIWQEFGVMNSP